MPDFKKIGIIGIGLIGGSIGFDVRKKKIAEMVIGYSRKIETMEKAVKNGVIDEYCKNPEDIIKNVDFLILATPISALSEYFKIIKNINPQITFTDVASVKKIVCDKVQKIIGKNANFVGSHPISGSEKSGIDFIKEGLFENKTVIITPTKNKNKIVEKKIEMFWEKLGSKVISMSPEQHDRILGFTSHLPHFLIYTLLSMGKKNKKISKDFFGSGFLDTTRIGKSNPEMWTEIFFSNRKNILKWIEKFEKELKNFKKYLKEKEYEKLKVALKESKLFREGIE